MTLRELVEFARQLVFASPDLNDQIMQSLEVAQMRIVAGANEVHECERAKEDIKKIAFIY